MLLCVHFPSGAFFWLRKRCVCVCFFFVKLSLHFQKKSFYNFTENVFFSKKKPLRENAHTAKYLYVFFSQKKAPAGKCTHSNIFFRFFLEKKAPAGNCRHGQKRFYSFLVFYFLGEKFSCITNFHI